MTFKRLVFFIVAAIIPMFIMSCGDDGGEMTEEERKTAYLTGNDTWTVKSVVVPSGTATTDDDWNGFEVEFTGSQLTTSGHPTGANVVWPSGSWVFNDDVSKIILTPSGGGNAIELTIITLNETSLSVRRVVPAGTEIGSRVAALGGEYTFNLE